MTDDKHHLIRKTLRKARQSIAADAQETAAKKLVERVRSLDFYQNANSLAFYQAVDGEISPAMILQDSLQAGKSCYLPVLSREDPESIVFAPFSESTELKENEWGIAEPPAEDILSPTKFDIVFVPLIAFDAKCFRLGMGKGFYDRTFSFKIFNRQSSPLLVGLAHECQLVESFPIASWDVRLDFVLTDEKIYRPDTA